MKTEPVSIEIQAFFRAIRATLALVLALVISLPALADTYRLSPGDKVLVQIIVLNNQTYVGTVDTSGEIRLPYLGTHQAANKTLDELAQDISFSVAGRQIQSVQNGITSVIVLDEQDIFLDIETYRPITVVGAVASPGRVAFEPGLNVRAAIGSAGGTAVGTKTDRVDDLANFRTRQAELRETEAWLAAELWRVSVLLSGEPSDVPIGPEYQIVLDRLSPEDIQGLRELIDGARVSLVRGREDITAKIALTKKRISFLESAFEQFQEASDIEESRLQDILQLSSRGLVTANALDSAREGALNASSRLLTTQADLAVAERELQSLMIDLQALDEDFMQNLRDGQSTAEQRFAEASARLSSLNRELAFGTLSENEEDSETELRILLHRQNGDTETSMEVQPNEILQPGDVVEVILSYK